VDLAFVISQRLQQLGLEQRDLARAARVTESYISQLLTRKKAPPAPNRTDIYGKMDGVLKLPPGELAKVAQLQRNEQLKRQLGDEPVPLFRKVRDLILRKCNRDQRDLVRAIFEKQPFGELERLVTQKLVEVVKQVARDHLENEHWLRHVAHLSGRSYEEMRVVALEFLDTDVFQMSVESSVAFLGPLIESWDIDLRTFDLEIILDRKMVARHVKRFEFNETEAALPVAEEPGFNAFLKDPSLSGTVTEEEIEFLKGLRFKSRRPTPLYYYRELQNLRDPLHFRPAE
jgi:transcriptional regulator with XRE-family HTH domain